MPGLTLEENRELKEHQRGKSRAACGVSYGAACYSFSLSTVAVSAACRRQDLSARVLTRQMQYDGCAGEDRCPSAGLGVPFLDAGRAATGLFLVIHRAGMAH